MLKKSNLTKLLAVSEAKLRSDAIAQFNVSKDAARKEYSNILQASPYLLDINDISRTFTQYHEQQAVLEEVKAAKPEFIFKLDNHKVFFVKRLDAIEFYIFNSDSISNATKVIFALALSKNWPRNGLFRSTAKGWYISHAWKSYNADLQPNAVLRCLREILKRLKYDYIVTDLAQTVAMNKVFMKYAKSFLATDCVYLAVSNRSKKKAIALIESEAQLKDAFKYIATAKDASFYKSIIVLNPKLSTSSIYKIFYDDALELTYEDAKQRGYLKNTDIDDKSELIRRGYIVGTDGIEL